MSEINFNLKQDLDTRKKIYYLKIATLDFFQFTGQNMSSTDDKYR